VEEQKGEGSTSCTPHDISMLLDEGKVVMQHAWGVEKL
jgi:hypothetical protein